MKILKQGKSKEEVDRIIKRVRQFECLTCGCVFEADDTEYKYQFCQREGTEWWECKCPNCDKLTNKSIPTRARNADNNNYSQFIKDISEEPIAEMREIKEGWL